MEEEKKGDDSGGKKNSGGGGAKRRKKKRGGINRSVLKEKEGDDYDDVKSWDKHDFYVGKKEGEELGNNERDEGDGDDDDGEREEEEYVGKG